eukprot:IDg9491t1
MATATKRRYETRIENRVFVIAALISVDALHFSQLRVYKYKHRLTETGARRDALRQRVFALPYPSRRATEWLPPCLTLEAWALVKTHSVLAAAPLAELYYATKPATPPATFYRIMAASLHAGDPLRMRLALILLLLLSAAVVALVLHEIGVYAAAARCAPPSAAHLATTRFSLMGCCATCARKRTRPKRCCHRRDGCSGRDRGLFEPRNPRNAQNGRQQLVWLRLHAGRLAANIPRRAAGFLPAAASSVHSTAASSDGALHRARVPRAFNLS